MATNIRFQGLVKTTAEIESDKFAGRIGWNTTLARFVAYYNSTQYAQMARRDVLETFAAGLQDSTLGVGLPMFAGTAGRLSTESVANFRSRISAVNKAGDTMTGSLTLSAGNLNVNAGAIQTAGVTRISAGGAGTLTTLSTTGLATLNSLKVTGQAGTGNRLIQAGADGTQSASIPVPTAFAQTLFDDADAAAARATLGAGTSNLALGETSSTAYRGDRGKTAYDHSQATGNPHGTTAAQVGAAAASHAHAIADVTSLQTVLDAKQAANVVAEKLITARPEEYQAGASIFGSTTGAWPAGSAGVVTTFIISTNRATQWDVGKTNGKIYFRSADASLESGWTEWSLVPVPTAYIQTLLDDADAAAARATLEINSVVGNSLAPSSHTIPNTTGTYYPFSSNFTIPANSLVPGSVRRFAFIASPASISDVNVAVLVDGTKVDPVISSNGDIVKYSIEISCYSSGASGISMISISSTDQSGAVKFQVLSQGFNTTVAHTVAIGTISTGINRSAFCQSAIMEPFAP
jgi:adhesin HecA-like repeat protein